MAGSPDERTLSRRELLATATALSGAALIPGAIDQQKALGTTAPAIPADPTKTPGPPTSAASARSPFVQMARTPTGAIAGSSLAPLHQMHGAITATDVHFERHHAGVAMIDPAKYKLLVHGLVERPLVFTLDELKSFPSVTRVYFLECSGNGRAAYTAPKPDLTPQLIDGLLGNAEWTGVSVRTLLNEVGVQRGASWALAEGGDAALLSRSIPLDKLMDDSLLVYAMNGEPLRPPAGYPVRLFNPGWEGNTCVKWLRRLELIAQPNMSRDETSKYTDPLPNDTSRQFSFVMDAKSTITYPTYPVQLTRRGWLEIRGLAWSGRGRITAVDVSTDGGRTWMAATLHEPVLSKAATYFTHPWQWNGERTTIISRAVDETGYVQPTLADYKRARGIGTSYHFNHLRSWTVEPDGRIVYEVGQ
ncbi:MAG TPA: sulfite dehydrogenase [Gemmatimonadaceae bacterium]|nr:sulfite dehydrogenase [Gemmatimonadaceae bacterium]